MRAELPLTNLDRAARQRLAGDKAAAGVFQPAEVVIDRGNLWVFSSKRLLHQRQRAQVKPLSLIEPAHVFVKRGQVVAEGRDIFTPTEQFGQLQRAKVKRFGYVVPPIRAPFIGRAAKLTNQLLKRGQ